MPPPTTWTLLRALGWAFKSKFLSTEAQAMDEFLQYVPNVVYGSSHALTGTVLISSTGLVNITTNFQATNAQVTIGAGKSLIVVSSGSLSCAGPASFTNTCSFTNTVTCSGAGKIMFTGATGFDASGGTTSYIRAGGTFQVEGNGGAGPGYITITSLAGIQVLSGGYLTMFSGSHGIVGGTFDFGSTSAVTVAGGFVVDGTGMLILNTAIVGIAGKLQWLGIGAFAEFDSGSVLNMGGTMIFSSGSSTSVQSSITMASGGELGWRTATGPTGNFTLNSTIHDVVFVPFGGVLSGNPTWTFLTGTTPKARVAVRRRNTGAPTGTLHISWNGSDIATFKPTAATMTTIFFQWDGSNWIVLHAFEIDTSIGGNSYTVV